nr:hypothetical protein RVX_1712 [Nitratidesulfovibrio sp. HK-II]
MPASYAPWPVPPARPSIRVRGAGLLRARPAMQEKAVSA